MVNYHTIFLCFIISGWARCTKLPRNGITPTTYYLLTFWFDEPDAFLFRKHKVYYNLFYYNHTVIAHVLFFKKIRFETHNQCFTTVFKLFTNRGTEDYRFIFILIDSCEKSNPQTWFNQFPTSHCLPGLILHQRPNLSLRYGSLMLFLLYHIVYTSDLPKYPIGSRNGNFLRLNFHKTRVCSS